MIRSVGVDIVTIERFAGKDREFLGQFLTDDELRRTPEGSQRDTFHATLFATKEAVLKGLGCGLQSGFRWHDISVTEGPGVQLSGWLGRLAEEMSVSAIHVSHSSSATHAVALVVFESNSPEVTP
jgi:holo-[acyl-carrier protein] synthase